MLTGKNLGHPDLRQQQCIWPVRRGCSARFPQFSMGAKLEHSRPRPFVVWQRYRADIIAIDMDTPAPPRVIPIKLDQTTPEPVPAEEVYSTYKRGNLPFLGPPMTELAFGKRKTRTPAAEGGATAASPTSQKKRLSRVSATSTSEKKKGSKASERSAAFRHRERG